MFGHRRTRVPTSLFLPFLFLASWLSLLLPFWINKISVCVWMGGSSISSLFPYFGSHLANPGEGGHQRDLSFAVDTGYRWLSACSAIGTTRRWMGDKPPSVSKKWKESNFSFFSSYFFSPPSFAFSLFSFFSSSLYLFSISSLLLARLRSCREKGFRKIGNPWKSMEDLKWINFTL